MILLDTSTLMDATFTLKDVVYIIVLLGGGVTGWVKLSNTITRLKDKDSQHERTTSKAEAELERFQQEQKARDERQDVAMKEMESRLYSYEKKQLEALNRVDLRMEQLRSEIKSERAELMSMIMRFLDKNKKDE